ncbi:hypothetical protein JYU34_001737 [Plutella xylostella]|uniref:Glyceraldehyde 3-phosphate dehydrogenase NAD(P) binding domain-containing protein n=1 Tax=Plutella xylostella TaxID=51655 RepID=A0ABQ7R4N4_PLUXY|nr:hypothetical protein JYU34_001737 [Plutella xylostella]
MVVKVGINGFGRIGRVVFRTCLENENIQIAALNDPAINVEYIAYLIKFDSTHGRFKGTVTHTETEVIIDGKKIKVYHEKLPVTIPWADTGTKYVVEASGLFTTLERACGHLRSASVRRVLVTAPSADVPMFIVGVNEHTMRSDHKVVSCASSTLYCLAPIIKILQDVFGVEEGFVTSIHAMTPSLKPLDGLCLRGKHWRDHRSILQNIIPANTGACKALPRIIPQIKDKLQGIAFRVPIVNVSVLDISVRLSSDTSLPIIVKHVDLAGRTTMKNIIKTSSEEAVSSDFIGDSCSCIVDVNSCLQLKSNFYKIVCWYENEYSYACRIVDMILLSEKSGQNRLLSKMTILRPLLSMNQNFLQQTELSARSITVSDQLSQYSDDTFISVNISESNKACRNIALTCNRCMNSTLMKSNMFSKVEREKTFNTVKQSMFTDAASNFAGALTDDTKEHSVKRGDKTTETYSHSTNSKYNSAKLVAKRVESTMAIKIWNDKHKEKQFKEAGNSCFQRYDAERSKGLNSYSKTQERLEAVKKEFNKMVNITEDLLRKSFNSKINISSVGKISVQEPEPSNTTVTTHSDASSKNCNAMVVTKHTSSMIADTPTAREEMAECSSNSSTTMKKIKTESIDTVSYGTTDISSIDATILNQQQGVTEIQYKHPDASIDLVDIQALIFDPQIFIKEILVTRPRVKMIPNSLKKTEIIMENVPSEITNYHDNDEDNMQKVYNSKNGLSDKLLVESPKHDLVIKSKDKIYERRNVQVEETTWKHHNIDEKLDNLDRYDQESILNPTVRGKELYNNSVSLDLSKVRAKSQEPLNGSNPIEQMQSSMKSIHSTNIKSQSHDNMKRSLQSTTRVINHNTPVAYPVNVDENNDHRTKYTIDVKEGNHRINPSNFGNITNLFRKDKKWDTRTIETILEELRRRRSELNKRDEKRNHDDEKIRVVESKHCIAMNDCKEVKEKWWNDITKMRLHGTSNVSSGPLVSPPITIYEDRRPKEDIYDKLDSISLTDSENSFHMRERQSEVITVSDLSNSMDDFKNLEKVCQILEISDDLSDRLLASLDNEPNTDTASRWSFKEFCKRIKLDEFCSEVFGSSEI